MNTSPTQFVISIMSRDRIGIIADLSSAISQMEGNIADSRQSVLCGYFTMILLAEFPPGVTRRDLERKLAEMDAHSETTINAVVEPAVEGALVSHTRIPDNAYVLTATGADKVGLVSTVASFCVRRRLNILDMSTTLSEGVYVMILIVEVQNGGSIEETRLDLRQFAKETGLNIALQHYDIFRAVNEINLPVR